MDEKTEKAVLQVALATGRDTWEVWADMQKAIEAYSLENGVNPDEVSVRISIYDQYTEVVARRKRRSPIWAREMKRVFS